MPNSSATISSLAISEYEHIANNNFSNILLSLEYLKEEAKRDGYENLYEIIKTASALGHAYSMDPENFNVELCEDDTQVMILFLLKFLNSSDQVRQDFFSLIDDDEYV